MSNIQVATAIKLSGVLTREFGREHLRYLDTSSVQKAFSALRKMLPGFKEAIARLQGLGIRFAIFRNRKNVGMDSFDANGARSDYRLKDDFADLNKEAEVSRIMSHRQVIWIWKSDGSYGKDLIARENQAVDPSTATGERNQSRWMGFITHGGQKTMEGVEEPIDWSGYPEGGMDPP